MDIYRIAVGMEIRGSVQGDLNKVLGTMRQIDDQAHRVERSVNAWGSSFQRAYSQISSLHRMMRSLASAGLGRDISSWAGGVGKTTNAFSGLNQAASTLDRTVGRISRNFASWEGRLNRAADRLQQAASASSMIVTPRGSVGHGPAAGRDRHYGGIVGGGIGIAAGYGTLESVVTQGALATRESIRAKNAGLTPSEIAGLNMEAGKLSKLYPSLGKLDIREAGRLLIPNVGTYATAMELLPEYMRGQVALQSLAGPEGAGRDMQAFARYIDIIGRSMSPGDTRQLIDGYIRARQLDPEAVRSQDFVNMAQALGAPGKGLGTGFLASLAPALIAQQGGSRTGVDLNSAFQNTVVNRATATALRAQQAAGLRYGLQLGKDGKKILNAGQLVDSQLYNQNTFAWAQKYVVPEMVAKGLLPKGYATGDYSQDLTPEQRSKATEHLSGMFSNRRGANIFSVFIQDMDQIVKIMERLKLARGAQDILGDQGRDPFIAGEALKKQVGNLSSALSEPQIAELVSNLNRFTKGVGEAADWLAAHPNRASGAFAAGAAGVGGLATAGAAALTIAAVSTLSLPALAIGSIAALTIGTFLFPWEALYKAMGWKPGITLGANPGSITNADAIGALPGVTTDDPIAARRKAATQGLGLSAQNVAEALKRQAELTGRVAEESKPAAGALEMLGGAIKSLYNSIMKGGSSSGGDAVWQFGSLGGGGLGRASIHKASLGTGANDNGGRSMRGIPDWIGATAWERNTLGLIQKHESGGRNVMNYIGDRTHTAQGYFQITNSNWRRIAPMLGIKTPNAMSSTYEEQARVAHHLLRHGGVQNWSNYNPALRNALRRGERAPLGEMPPAVGAPPRQKQEIRVEVPVSIGGERVARVMTRVMADHHRFPTSTGGMDGHGSWVPPGTTLTDAA